MISRALGLGLMIILLKFLMKDAFSAFESSLIQAFGSASVLLGKIGTMPPASDTLNLLPQ